MPSVPVPSVPIPAAQASARARALDLFVKLMRAQRAVFDQVEPSITSTGLTVNQFAVLEALLHCGPLSHGALKAKVLTSAANLTDVIDKLEARGLITRCRGTEDARRISVGLTSCGHALISAAFGPHAATIECVMGRLSAVEQNQLAELLRKLGLAAEAGPPK